MSTNTLTNIDQKISKFQKLILQGVNAWTTAGKILVEILDADANAAEKILDQCDGITRAHLAKFEAIGRGALEPKLLLNGSVGYQRLAKAPVSDQRKALSDGIKLYEPTRDGGITHRIVRPEDLSPFQASQVFAPGGAIRSPQEQRAYLAQRESRKAATVRQTIDLPDYKITRGKVIFNAGCTLTASQVAGILQELTKSK